MRVIRRFLIFFAIEHGVVFPSYNGGVLRRVLTGIGFVADEPSDPLQCICLHARRQWNSSSGPNHEHSFIRRHIQGVADRSSSWKIPETSSNDLWDRARRGGGHSLWNNALLRIETVPLVASLANMERLKVQWSSLSSSQRSYGRWLGVDCRGKARLHRSLLVRHDLQLDANRWYSHNEVEGNEWDYLMPSQSSSLTGCTRTDLRSDTARIRCRRRPSISSWNNRTAYANRFGSDVFEDLSFLVRIVLHSRRTVVVHFSYVVSAYTEAHCGVSAAQVGWRTPAQVSKGQGFQSIC